jgi:hypothetical protein
MSTEIEIVEKREPFLLDIKQAETLAKQYRVPVEDVLLIALNLSGVHFGNIGNDRGRFSISMPSGRTYPVAVTITNSPISNFVHDGKSVTLGSSEIGTATLIEKDTCTDSYWRSRNHLTLNSNSRSVCQGCKFCGTYNLERDDAPLIDEKVLNERALDLENEVGSLKNLEAVGIVTGCFRDEEAVVNHISSIRRVFSHFGFSGEIQYVGSQIRSEDAIKRLVAQGQFSLYLTLEVFSRRELLMKRQKSSLKLSDAKTTLEIAKKSGADTSFLYIAGLDSFPIIENELPQFSDLVTRLPQIQTYQLYTPDQDSLRSKDARSLDYYLKLRTLGEKTFPNLKPILSHNFRGLWFSEFNGQKI